MNVTRPVLRYHGGKWILAPWIIAHFPTHRIYVEPFGGGASVLLQKERAAHMEIYNDLDSEIVNLFQVLRDPQQGEKLIALLELTPFAKDEFELAYQSANDPVEAARRVIVRSLMGFGTTGSNGRKTGFRSKSVRANSPPARVWSLYPPSLRAVIERLQGVVIDNRPAENVIAHWDSEEDVLVLH